MKNHLEELAEKYNNPAFIADDPIQIPHNYTRKEDIEIAGFLVAIIAWGQRKTIINNGLRMMNMMENSPYDFIINHTPAELNRLNSFCHRTFNSSDLIDFIKVLKIIYTKEKGLENIFTSGYLSANDLKGGIINLRKLFEENITTHRTLKHIANIEKGSAAKRINMFLRWMVRYDNKGVDFGLWKNIPMSALYIPLDVHTGRSARENNLLSRKQNDWKAVEELTNNLKKIHPQDPIKYDYALFGLGVYS